MTIFYYANGIATIIKNDFVARDVVIAKPAFVQAESFIHDLAIKERITDGVGSELTDEDIKAMEAFIDAYILDKSTVVPDAAVIKHYVNVNGLYLGNSKINDTDVEVPSAPIADNKYFWNGTEYILGYCVNATTGGLIMDAVVPGEFIYIDRTLINHNACTACQVYDFETKTIIVNLNIARSMCNKKLTTAMQTEISNKISVVGGFGPYETVSHWAQVAETNAYIADNNAPTPFIDTLLTARNFTGETKEILVGKIKAKADAWNVYYPTLLGKYHNKVKELEEASTLDAITAITW